MSECNRCTVPFAAHEATLARQERSFRRLWIVCIILIVALVATNIAWIMYESQYETVIETDKTEISAEQNGSGTNIVGGGNVNYGAEGQDNENTHSAPQSP